jgi:hypothetical protein
MKLIDKLNPGPDNEGESRPAEFGIRRPDSFRSIARMSRVEETIFSSNANDADIAPGTQRKINR